MDIAARPIKPGAEFTKEAVIPLCVLAGIIAIDHLFLPGATITPVCNFLAMGILALYLHPRWMVFWAVCFTCSSLFMLANSGFSHPGPPDKILTSESRSIGSLAGGLVAVLLCATRWKASRSHAQLANLVRRLPVPFVLSDKNGTLLFVSEEAGRLMNISPADAAGQSYFALLFHLSEKGAAIQQYVGLLDSEDSHETSIELRLLNSPEKSWRGTLMPVDMEAGRCLITVIAPPASA